MSHYFEQFIPPLRPDRKKTTVTTSRFDRRNVSIRSTCYLLGPQSGPRRVQLWCGFAYL